LVCIAMTIVRTPAAGLPELEEKWWIEAAGEDPRALRFNRASLLAHVESVENPFLIASSWDGTSLHGIAVGRIELHSQDRSVLMIATPGAIQRRRSSGLLTACGVDPVETGRDLILALAERAR